MATEAKLGIIVFSGDYDRVHYALITAAAAAATDRRVTLFFTMDATRALLDTGADGADGAPGWAALAAGADGISATARDAAHGAKGIATFEELLAACIELGVTFMVCETGLKALDLTAAALRPDVPVKAGGVVSLLAAVGRDGAMLFI